ncbi:hypothetical protein C2134_02795 [Chromobacterium sinusclupearum]|uniref:Uncharacterized protein n=1 Tax=Chromobacterium sinusclupearum TaxID=2077146 RepID=A0A2K4MTP9_9NEIS|nr:DUF2786 domain-containing protein [Chromobacterium sinusclupearum]POB00136.1 hypothetical protein C2134_02795 [Chromobacterium sinusclupearum]
MDKKSAISKIRKCLALSKSANEHEAATALKQARVLMNKFGVTDSDIQIAEIKEIHAKASAKRRPADYESGLAMAMAEAFGCEILFFPSRTSQGQWTFVGEEVSAEIAKYAFTVLLRQLKSQRLRFIEEQCRYLRRASKTRRADLFCDGWVRMVYQTAKQIAPERKSDALGAYMRKQYSDIEELAGRDRNEGRDFSSQDHAAYRAGREAGERVKLHHAMHGTSTPPQALLGAN